MENIKIKWLGIFVGIFISILVIIGSLNFYEIGLFTVIYMPCSLLYIKSITKSGNEKLYPKTTPKERIFWNSLLSAFLSVITIDMSFSLIGVIIAMFLLMLKLAASTNISLQKRKRSYNQVIEDYKNLPKYSTLGLNNN